MAERDRGEATGPPPDRQAVEAMLFGPAGDRRFTQDSPVLPEVWMAFALSPNERQDLLVTPSRETSAGALAATIRDRLQAIDEMGDDPDAGGSPHRLVHLPATVVACMSLEEMMRAVLPATRWWRRRMGQLGRLRVDRLDAAPPIPDDADDPHRDERFPRPSEGTRARLANALWRYGLMGSVPGEDDVRHRLSETAMPTDVLRLVRLVGTIVLHKSGSNGSDPFQADPFGAPPAGGPADARGRADAIAGAFLSLFEDWPLYEPAERALVWRVNLNRPASGSIRRSVLAVKGDAARRVFDVTGRGIMWAVVDCGIDAEHPAFRDHVEGGSRVRMTFDFSDLRDLLDPTSERFEREVRKAETLKGDADGDEAALAARRLRERIMSAQDIDWAVLEPFVRRSPEQRVRPKHEHGTHVAGIIGADWRRGGAVEDDGGEAPPDMPSDVVGMSPEISLIDCRVLDPANGSASEFEVVAAMQFLRHLNDRSSVRMVHGVNLSLSLPHDVENYACGQTPICVECENAVASGIVVVAAAGNHGYRLEGSNNGRGMFRPSSITDPGNAEGVITVGSTHRYRPHQFGVSYFSSRGPTGDGRRKPDLVAPGEKVAGPLPGGRIGWRDGTSMAAPHVSGAAALLMARHGEFMGRPDRVKAILCESATDLNRYPHYQGAGMLDALRALQSV